jgi:glycosyltransferase involved in cell wall biosynthesis
VALRVLFLCGLPRRAPSSRVRVYEHLSGLAELGIEGTVRPFLSEGAFAGFYSLSRGEVLRKIGAAGLGLFRRARHLLDARRFDAVVVHREILPRGNPRALRWLRRRGVPVLYDLDDAIWLAPRDHVEADQDSRRRMVRFKDPGEVNELLRDATRVAAGCPVIRDHARSLGATADLVPTPVDTERFRPRSRKPRARPVVGWIGSPTATYCLRRIVPALERAARRTPFDLRVIGADETLEGEGFRILHDRWSLEREAELLATMDVGLYPLPDNPWTRGKCGYKALVYFAAGVPAIVSPVGVNEELAGDGARALVARSEREWEEAVVRLLEDEDARAAMARRARYWVESRYSYAAVTPLLAESIRAAVDR